MSLKIKKGAIIHPYGAACNDFDENSNLSQSILQHLKTRFPEQIEEMSETKKELKTKK